jgi:hypothetical protein
MRPFSRRSVHFRSAASRIAVTATLATAASLGIPGIAEAAPNGACGHGAYFTTKNVKKHRNVVMHITASCIGVTPSQTEVRASLQESGNSLFDLERIKHERVYRVNFYGQCGVDCVNSSMFATLTTDFYFREPQTLDGPPIGCVLYDPLHIHCTQVWNFAVEPDGDVYLLPGS